MKFILALLKSRKFWLAVGGIVTVILVQTGMPEDQATKITEAVLWLLTAVIGGIAAEDVAKTIKGG